MVAFWRDCCFVVCRFALRGVVYLAFFLGREREGFGASLPHLGLSLEEDAWPPPAPEYEFSSPVNC